MVWRCVCVCFGMCLSCRYQCLQPLGYFWKPTLSSRRGLAAAEHNTNDDRIEVESNQRHFLHGRTPVNSLVITHLEMLRPALLAYLICVFFTACTPSGDDPDFTAKEWKWQGRQTCLPQRQHPWLINSISFSLVFVFLLDAKTVLLDPAELYRFVRLRRLRRLRHAFAKMLRSLGTRRTGPNHNGRTGRTGRIFGCRFHWGRCGSAKSRGEATGSPTRRCQGSAAAKDATRGPGRAGWTPAEESDSGWH